MKAIRTTALLLTAVAALAAAPHPSLGGDDPPRDAGLPTIADIMDQAHRCRTAYIGVIRNEVEKDDPDWGLVQEKSRALIEMGGLLARNTPPKGTHESWERFTTLYVANATLMTDAAERRSKDEVMYHQEKLRQMCARCHAAHRQ